jgi:hypothetical protein
MHKLFAVLITIAAPLWATAESAGYKLEVLAEPLEHPWSIAFLPALLVAFFVAWLVVRRTGAPLPWFGLAGGLAILAAIPLVNWLSPLALLFGATRDLSCVVLMAAGGTVGGILFAWMTHLWRPELPA